MVLTRGETFSNNPLVFIYICYVNTLTFMSFCDTLWASVIIAWGGTVTRWRTDVNKSDYYSACL